VPVPNIMQHDGVSRVAALVLFASRVATALPLAQHGVLLSNLQYRVRTLDFNASSTSEPNFSSELVVQGAAQIEDAIAATVNSTGSILLDRLNATILTESLPKLQRIENNQIAAAQHALHAERNRQLGLQNKTVNQSAYKDDLNHKAMLEAAEEFGRSHAQNAIVEAMGPAMKESITAEEKAEELRIETARFSHTADAAAQEAAKVAQVAERVAKTLPKADAQRAVVWIREVEEEARAMQDEGDQSERLAKMAEEVMKGAGNVADEALVRAQDAEAKAKKSLEAAQANANRLAKLHQRALRAQEKASSKIDAYDK